MAKGKNKDISKTKPSNLSGSKDFNDSMTIGKGKIDNDHKVKLSKKRSDDEIPMPTRPYEVG